jgi:autotransporter-associated beta strand protein
MEGGPTINTATLRWDPTNDQDISSRLVMFDAKTAILLMADGGEPYDSSNVIFANAIGNSSSAKLQKTGNGTLALTQPSTYTGGTTITQGTLEFANDALGTTGAVTMDGGILRWATGNTQDVSARITMVDAKTASFSTNGNNVTLSNAIGNASTGNFSKTNTPGTLTLTSIATYTGTTAISGGTLALGANNIIPDSSNVSIGAATLDAATFDDQLGTLDVTAAATINLGTGANLLFADSNLVDWTGGTLNITGTFVSGSSIKFATTGGLTSTQLALITLNGAPAIFTLDASGFLTAAPVAGFAAWQSANSTASGIDADHDNDGLSNGIEWFLGGTSDTTGFNPLPGVTDAAGTLTVTWTKAATFTGTYGTNFVVETSPNLATTWTPVTEGVGADKVEITGNSVKYTFPAGTTNFARLKVITTP